MDRGRDTWDYLSYYLQMWQGDPVFRPLMAMRTPVTPLVIGGAMQIGGSALLEIVMGLVYAGSILAWSMVALRFGRLPALVSALILLAYAPYGSLFHTAASDGLFAAAFAFFCLGIVHTAQAPATWKFALLSMGAVLAFLTRPPGGVLVAAVLLPLFLKGTFRRRLVWAGAFALVSIGLLAGWMGYNALRYDDFTLTRQRTAWVPFGAAFGDRAVEAGNGPASRELARAVERHILAQPPYRRTKESVATYFDNPSTYEFIHLLALADRLWGWKSDYRILHRVAAEANSGSSGGSGGSRFRVLAQRTRTMLDFRYWRERSVRHEPDPPPPATQLVDGRLVPNPAALGPAPEMVPYGWMWCASPTLARCVASDVARALSDPEQQRQYTSLVKRLGAWDRELPSRAGNTWVAGQLKRYTWRLPPGWFWLVLAAAALVIRRPSGTRVAIALVVVGLLVIVAHAVSGVTDAAYALAVYPAFIVAGIAGLLGTKPGSRAPVK